MIVDKIRIADAGNRAKSRWQIHIDTYVDPEGGGNRIWQANTEPAGFNARGDAELFVDELERRLRENLGHEVERG